MEGRDHPHEVVVKTARGCADRAALRGGAEVGGADVGDGARELAGGGGVLGAEVLDGAELLGSGAGGNALGEDADGGFVLNVGGRGVAGGGVAADDVIVEHGFELPALGFGELGEGRAAVQ